MKDLLDELIRLLRAMWPHRWLAMFTAWAVALSGWLVVYAMPDVYEANARFYVDASTRLREVVQKLGMQADVSSRVFLVRQAMLGRPQLEKVARDTDLTFRAKTEKEYEQLLITLLENVTVSTGRSRQAKNLFTIGYRDQDRDMSVQVVRALLNNFEENVIERKDVDSKSTVMFLQDQLSYYRNLLQQTEGELEAFKRAHPGFANQERVGTFERVQQEQTLLDELLSERTVEANKRNELRRQLSKVTPHTPQVDEGETYSPLIPGSETSSRINELERNQKVLLLRYTPQHPDVKAMGEQIRQLNIQLRGELERAAAERGEDGVASATNPVYVEIQIVLSNANLRLAELDAMITDRRERIGKLESKLSTAPALERQFTDLTRDYQQYRELYGEVLMQTERERIGRVGDEQDVVAFNVIDPPIAELDPVAPRRTLLLLAVLVFSLGAGAISSFFLALIKPTFLDSRHLSQFISLPVLGNVSWNQQVYSRKVVLKRVSGFVSAILALQVVCFFVVLEQDTVGTAFRELLLRFGS